MYGKAKKAGVKRIAIIPFENKNGKNGYGAIADTIVDGTVSDVMNNSSATRVSGDCLPRPVGANNAGATIRFDGISRRKNCKSAWKKQIIFVPGKNPKPEAALHRELLWRTLVEGVSRADSAVADRLRASYAQFHLVSWNYLYYRTHKDITSDIPWIDALIQKRGPTEQDIHDANSWNKWLSHLLLTLGDHIPLLIRLLPAVVRSTATEINRYFNNADNVASQVRELLKQTLRPMLQRQDEVLLIGHSLGAVIAYDTLWELSRQEGVTGEQEGVTGKVDFLTLGSPMGMHYVKRRLLGMNGGGKKSYPDLIRRWVNLSAVGDVTALNQNLHDSFHPMLELGLIESIEDYCHGIYNFFHTDEGLNCHRSYGYLVNPAVGGIIADWWKHH